MNAWDDFSGHGSYRHRAVLTVSNIEKLMELRKGIIERHEYHDRCLCLGHAHGAHQRGIDRLSL